MAMLRHLPVAAHNGTLPTCGMVKPLFQLQQQAITVHSKSSLDDDDGDGGHGLLDAARDDVAGAAQGVASEVGGLVSALPFPSFVHHSSDSDPDKSSGESDDANHTAKQPERELLCLAPYLMNCSTWEDLAEDRPCPPQCPFVASVKPFACTFACVNASQCHVADSASPYANNRTMRCEEATIKGCEVAVESPSVCERCARHFARTSSGMWCTYDGDNYFIWFLDALQALGYWGVAVLVFLVTSLVFRLHNDLNRYWRLLTFARIHHHMCKVRRNPKIWPGSPLYSLCVNVHTKFIIGVGMPLYYNSLVFLFLLALTIFIGTTVALSTESSSLFNFASTSKDSLQLYGVALYPSCDSVSDASICSWAVSNDGRMEHAMLNVKVTSANFMRVLALMTLVLYFVVLAGMLLHARGQLWHAEWFFRKYSTMKDVAVMLDGLPPSATSEEGIGRAIKEAIHIDVQQVSIGYNFTSRRDEVWALIDRHLSYADAKVRGGHPPGIALPRVSVAQMEQLEDRMQRVVTGFGRRVREGRRLIETEIGQGDLDEAWEADREHVRAWFAPSAARPMEGTGYAWIVFADRQERDLALQRLAALNGGEGFIWRDKLAQKSHFVKAELPYCEPSNVNWANLSYSACARRCRCFMAWLFFLAAGVALAALIFIPYAYYVTSFVSQAGQFPDGLLMGILGVIVGISWWAMCFTIGNCVGYIRMHTVESECLFIFVAFTIFCISATAFNAYLTWFYTRIQWESPGGKAAVNHIRQTLADGPSTTLRDLRLEIDLGIRIFQMLVPGVLFTPAILTPVNNFIVPYFREGALLVMFGKNKSGREAEKYLEPLPLGLPWDYQGHITLPFCCCITLFIMSPAMWWTLGYLTIWCFCFYFYQRVMHLRVCKKMFYTATTLDRTVLYVGWGALLGELAACTAYWRVRLQEWPLVSIPIAIAASTILYWSLLRLWVGVKWPSVDQQLPTIDTDTTPRTCKFGEDKADAWSDEASQCYDWQNVNPVYVLKSQYCEDFTFGAPPRYFYEPGKEYLQLLQGNEFKPVPEDPRWNLRDPGAWLELEGLGCAQTFIPEDLHEVTTHPLHEAAYSPL